MSGDESALGWHAWGAALPTAAWGVLNDRVASRLGYEPAESEHPDSWQYARGPSKLSFVREVRGGVVHGWVLLPDELLAVTSCGAVLDQFGAWARALSPFLARSWNSGPPSWRYYRAGGRAPRVPGLGSILQRTPRISVAGPDHRDRLSTPLFARRRRRLGAVARGATPPPAAGACSCCSVPGHYAAAGDRPEIQRPAVRLRSRGRERRHLRGVAWAQCFGSIWPPLTKTVRLTSVNGLSGIQIPRYTAWDLPTWSSNSRESAPWCGCESLTTPPISTTTLTTTRPRMTIAFPPNVFWRNLGYRGSCQYRVFPQGVEAKVLIRQQSFLEHDGELIAGVRRVCATARDNRGLVLTSVHQ